MVTLTWLNIGYFLTLVADLRSWGSDLMASKV